MNPGLAAARFLSASPARTAVIGAGIGAATGGLTAQPGEGMQGAMHGALRGAAVGGTVGGIGRGLRDTRLLHGLDNPSAAPLSAMGTVAGTARRASQGVVNFGKRQIHGATGLFDHDAIGMAGTRASEKRVRLFGARTADEVRHAAPEAHQAIRDKGRAMIEAERDAGRRSQSLADAGVTTLPGMTRALATKGRRAEALRAMGRSVFDGTGGAAATLGLPALMYGPSIMRGDESAQGGLTTGQKVRNAIGTTATGIAFSGMPVIPGMAASIGAERLLGVNRTPRPLPPPVVEPTT